MASEEEGEGGQEGGEEESEEDGQVEVQHEKSEIRNSKLRGGGSLGEEGGL
jgi:hypothetical protein